MANSTKRHLHRDDDLRDREHKQTVIKLGITLFVFLSVAIAFALTVMCYVPVFGWGW